MSREKINKINIEEILDRCKKWSGIASDQQMAEILGTSKQSYANWKTRGAVPWPKLYFFATKNNLSLDWLINGKEEQPSEINLSVQETPRFRTMHKDAAYDNYIPVPLLKDAAAAGQPAEINERDLDGYCLIYADKDWMRGDPEKYTCVRIRGQSMSPILEHGDIVAIDHNQRDPRRLDGHMAAFRKNGGVTVKWLKIVDGGIVGVPQNVAEKLDTVIKITADEAEEAIIGRIAWWWAKR